jgi:AraC-like DNA-binding protein
LLASWVNWLRSLVSDCSQLQVRLAHTRPADVQAHAQCFACQLLFDAECYGLLLPHDLLAQPLLQANPGLQQVLQGHAEALLARLPGASLSSRVVSLLSRQLAHGEPDRASLASSLNLSERTLQRRLADEGSSYQKLLGDTRRLLAERYLGEGRLPATEIALLLGYSEPSVFFRAFRQWTGLTPGEYRARPRP